MSDMSAEFEPLETLPIWTWECSNEGVYTTCSPEVSNCLGISPDEVIGQNLRTYRLDSTSITRLSEIFEQNNFPAEVDVSFLSAQNTWISARMHIFCRRDSGDTKTGYHGFNKVLAQFDLALPEIETASKEPPRAEPTPVTYTTVRGISIIGEEIQTSTQIWSSAGQESALKRKIIFQSAHNQFPAVIAVPFHFGEHGAGILEIVDEDAHRIWDEDDLLLVEDVVKQLTLTLENVLLYNVAQQELLQRTRAEEEILRRNVELARLNQIGQELRRLSSQEEIFGYIFDQMQQLIDNRNLIISLYKEENSLWIPVHSEGGVLLPPLERAFENGIPEYVLRTQNPLLITSQAKAELHNLGIETPDTIPRSLLAVPMITGKRAIGAIILQDFEKENAYNFIHLELLSTIATQVAAALENVTLLEKLQESLNELKELDRLKSQFLANMSHELRNPLNSIIGFSRVIMKGIDGPVNETQIQDLAAIYNSGQHLLNLINDVLDLSKIEAGKMELSIGEVNIAETIESVMSTASGLVKDKPITLVQKVPHDLPPITADATRVRQVLLNLISNAAKFTEQGEITIEAAHGESHEGVQEITIWVTDTGAGIASNDQKKLFQPFSQVDGSPTRKSGGTGLGLSICKSLIEMHGGRIGIQWSEVGKGSSFYFTLPIAGPPNQKS